MSNAPGPCTHLEAVSVTGTRVVLVWTPPVVGDRPLYYLVLGRLLGSRSWSMAWSVTKPSVIIATRPGTTYEFEVLAHNN